MKHGIMKWLVSDMSMQIKIHDDITSNTSYYGTVTKNEKNYDFVAIVEYHSDPEYMETNIEWVDEPENSYKAIGRITKLVGDMWENSRVFDKE